MLSNKCIPYAAVLQKKSLQKEGELPFSALHLKRVRATGKTRESVTTPKRGTHIAVNLGVIQDVSIFLKRVFTQSWFLPALLVSNTSKYETHYRLLYAEHNKNVNNSS